MSEEKHNEETGVVGASIQWAKDHPKTLSAVGTGVAAAAGVYGAPPEYVSGFLKFLGGLLGIL